MKTETIFISIFALIAGVITYAADWQREQDKEDARLNSLIERQTILLEMQVDYNEARRNINASPVRFRDIRSTYDIELDQGGNNGR